MQSSFNMATSTFANEPLLSKLPLPSLESTLENLLYAIKPLISHKDYTRLLDQSIDFLNSKNVKTIQQHLAKSHSVNDCYLDGQGISTNSPGIYGELRGSTLPRNPFFILEDDPLAKLAPPTQSFRAAVLVTSSLRFISSLRSENITPDYTPTSGKPLTMSNYRQLFGTTRIPVDGNDGSIGIGSRKKFNSKTIVVLCKSQFYSLEVLNNDDLLWFTKHELATIFEQIIEESSALSRYEINKLAIGAITTESKSAWRALRIRLRETNAELLQLIDDALFVICLDSTSPVTEDEKIECISHGTSLLDDENFQVGSCLNRWYDKLQIVVTKNAVAGVIWESTSTDATSVLRFFTDIYTDSVLRVARKINGLNYTLFTYIKAVDVIGEKKPNYKKLKFQLTADINNALHLAETRLADLIGQHEYCSIKISKFGKDFITGKMNLPSDSLIQMSIQIAHYALYGKLCSSNEPVSTRRFKSSRTELINIQSDLVLRCCQAFITTSTPEERWHHLKQACAEHSQRILTASHGGGFERHFSALRSAYNQRDLLNRLNPELPPIESVDVPLIFDPLVDNIYKTEILIANCGNPALSMFGVTPAVSYGYGIGYIIKSTSLEIVASSQWRQTGRFLDTVNSVLNQIKSCWKTVTNISTNEIITKNGISRARELENNYTIDTYTGDTLQILQSFPMDLIKSNNSSGPNNSFYNNRSFLKSTERDKSTILGGYDYFDVETLNTITRSNSEVNSSSNSRNISSTNIRDLLLLEGDSRTGSPLNPNIQKRKQPTSKASIGKKIELEEDEL